MYTTVIINGKSELFYTPSETSLSYEHIVKLLQKTGDLTVAYKGKTSQGILASTESVVIEEGMTFNVYDTGDA